MNRSPSLTDAARVNALLRSLNKSGESRPGAARRRTRAADRSDNSLRSEGFDTPTTEDTVAPVRREDASRAQESEATHPTPAGEGEPAPRLTAEPAIEHPDDEPEDLSGADEETASALAIRELLSISELDLGAGLQSRLVALVGRLVRTLRGVDGFVADESGLAMAGPASCEDAAARSSLAWSFVAGLDEPTVPDAVIFTQGDGPIVHAFLVKSSLGPMTVGVRARHVIPDDLLSAARAALSAAFPTEPR